MKYIDPITSLVLYSADPAYKVHPQQLCDAIKHLAYADIKPPEQKKQGLVSPITEDQSATLVEERHSKYLIMAFRADTKNIKPATLKKEMSNLSKAQYNKKLSELTKAEQKTIKAAAVVNLLPNTPVDTKISRVVINTTECQIAVESSSVAGADAIMDILIPHLKKAAGAGTTIAPIRPEKLVLSEIFTNWLKEKQAPEPFELGKYVHLVDSGGDAPPNAKLDNHDLTATEVDTHLDSGKGAKEIGLVYNQMIYCVATQEFVFKKIAPSKSMKAIIKSAQQSSKDDPLVPMMMLMNTMFMAAQELVEKI